MTNQPRVFVTRELADGPLRRLRESCRTEVWPDRMPPPREDLLRSIVGVDGVLTLLSDRVDAEFMDAAGASLKVISNFAVGFNNIDVDEARSRGIAVGNTPDVLTDATADMAVALLLAAGRRLKEASDQVRQGGWLTWEPTGLLGTDLVGRTVGILGMGRIGMATARRLRFGWGMKVLYHSRSPKPEAEDELQAERVSLDELWRRSDFVSVHTDLNDQTRHLVNADAMAAMKSTAVLVNTSRGDIVDQDALADALRQGQIAAAGLDVTSPEPIDSRHPLVSLSNCLIVPHIGSATPQTRTAMADIAVDNLIAGVTGEPLRAPVA